MNHATLGVTSRAPALDVSDDTLAFGSTTGNLYLSEDRGEHWQTVANNLPPIYSVRFG